MTNYYIIYKPDSSKNFFFSSDTEGEMLDHIMLFDDQEASDLGNYEIYERII